MKEVGLYGRDFGTASAIRKFTTKYPKHCFIRTTGNTWKNKCNDCDWTFIKRIEKPNLLDFGMLKKVKDIVLWTKMAEGVINRSQLISIATWVVRENNPNLLEECGVDLVLTDKWARGVLEKQRYHQKSKSFPQVFSQTKFHFTEKQISIGFWIWYLPIFVHQYRSNSRHMLTQGNTRPHKSRGW